MPTWCYNYLIAEHDNSDLPYRLAQACNDNNLLEAVLPLPSASDDEVREYLKENDIADSRKLGFETDRDAYSYSWKCENWGTKWDIWNGAAKLDRKGRRVHCVFNTAWGVPMPVVHNLEDQGCFTTLYFELDSGRDLGFYVTGLGYHKYSFQEIDSRILTALLPPAVDRLLCCSELWANDAPVGDFVVIGPSGAGDTL